MLPTGSWSGSELREFQKYVTSNVVRDCSTREFDYAKIETATAVYHRIEVGVRQSERLQSVYGGAYIDDTDDLMVLLAEDTEQILAEFEKLAEGDTVLFAPCIYTHAELYEAQEAGLVQINAPVLYTTVISVQKNCVEVGIVDSLPGVQDPFWDEIQAGYPVRLLRYDEWAEMSSCMRPAAVIPRISP